MRKMPLLSYSFDGVSSCTDVAATALSIDATCSTVSTMCHGSLTTADSVKRPLVGSVRREIALADISRDRTLPKPRRIVCIGVNDRGGSVEHLPGEGGDNDAKPSMFVRFTSALVGHERDLVRPPESPQSDDEGEIVAVICASGPCIPQRRSR